MSRDIYPPRDSYYNLLELPPYRQPAQSPRRDDDDISTPSTAAPPRTSLSTAMHNPISAPTDEHDANEGEEAEEHVGHDHQRSNCPNEWDKACTLSIMEEVRSLMNELSSKDRGASLYNVYLDKWNCVYRIPRNIQDLLGRMFDHGQEMAGISICLLQPGAIEHVEEHARNLDTKDFGAFILEHYNSRSSRGGAPTGEGIASAVQMIRAVVSAWDQENPDDAEFIPPTAHMIEEPQNADQYWDSQPDLAARLVSLDYPTPAPHPEVMKKTLLQKNLGTSSPSASGSRVRGSSGKASASASGKASGKASGSSTPAMIAAAVATTAGAANPTQRFRKVYLKEEMFHAYFSYNFWSIILDKFDITSPAERRAIAHRIAGVLHDSIMVEA